MLRKFILIISLLILTSCGNQTIETNHTTNTTLIHLFNRGYSVSLFNFGEIVNKLSEIKTKDDITYINGMVDTYLTNNSQFMVSMIVSSDKRGDSKVIDPVIREDIVDMVHNQVSFMKQIKELLDQESLQNLKWQSNYYKDIYKVERELNMDIPKEQDGLTKYKLSLEQMNSLLTKAISHKK
ncbi:hypothetical protein [Brevibacillus laterosporus]|uniref:Lipoprotein n=1 Tax=Brevibacillus laterosporus TaxID=1465 RepID=A0AAP3GBG9_BRELA|nr:hypothetical protein [Brevibacillus laterosporus]MCR8980897.1 hypothetical protein [Brevibacillus laterosporus]MCZ0808052.1 hypothetical protein [Brevibacillus laterosporus]MCZ0828942.1 hypothetical protein [Brevibacillus laterosporus]MCZ0852480.1 hypothetical protein [Brevibacillus laterosporus]PPA90195.1 hypothetical protein C4A77_25110 [Brevibacillus laterosporus]